MRNLNQTLIVGYSLSEEWNCSGQQILFELWILTHLRNDNTTNTSIPSTQLFGTLEYLLTIM